MKWEFKTIQAVKQEFQSQSTELGADGWEIVKTNDVNGWTIGYFKRPVETDDSFDSLSGLITLISNPDKAKAVAANLKDAHEKHKTSLSELTTKQKEVNETLAAILVKEKDAQSEIIEATRLKEITAKELSSLNDQRKDHEASKASFQIVVNTHNSKVRDHEAKVASDKIDLAKQIEDHTNRVERANRVLDIREKTLLDREKAVLLKEAEAEEIRLGAEALVSKIGRK